MVSPSQPGRPGPSRVSPGRGGAGVGVAGEAGLALLARETAYYRRLITILVYPSAYVAHGVESLGGGVVLEGPQGRLGEAWTAGVVVLSWDDVRKGAADIRDG